MTTEAKLFEELGTDARLLLLKAAGAELEALGDQCASLSELSVSDGVRDRLTISLDLLRALDDPDTADFVNDALSDLGWTDKNFHASVSHRQRVAHLISTKQSEAENIARWWHANRSYWSQKSVSGFKLDKVPIEETVFDSKSHSELQERMNLVVAQYQKGHRIYNMKSYWRPSYGIPSLSNQLFQIDFRISKPPTRVAIEAEGKEEQRSFRFLVDMSIVIDPEQATVFVTSQSQSKKYRQAIAQEVRTHFLGIGGSPPFLEPLKVHVDNLDKPVVFPFNISDGFEDISLRSISFRSRYNGQDYVARLVADGRHGSVHELPSFKVAFSPKVYRAELVYRFRPRPGESVGRVRTAVLRDGHRISYQRCSPGESALMEKVLLKAGLLSEASKPSKIVDLHQLGRLREGGLVAEVQQALGGKIFSALREIGVLKPGAPSQRAWCDLCLTSHDTILREADCYLDCLIERRPVSDAMFETTNFDGLALASWIAEQVKVDQRSPREIDADTWFLGVTPNERGKSVGLAITSHSGSENALSYALQFLNDHPKIPAGALLVLEDSLSGVSLTRGWRTVSISAILRLLADDLHVDRKALFRVMDGKTYAPEQKKVTRQELLRFFDQSDTGLGPYEEARRIIKEKPDWHWKRDSLARVLKKGRPERFN